MGAGCSTDNAPSPATVEVGRAKSAIEVGRVKSRVYSKTGSGALSGGNGSRKREELAAQFIAEFPADDDPDSPPTYPDGSREATLLKVFQLLDSGRCNYIEVPTWKEYALQAGLTMEALAKELAVIVAEQAEPGDPRVGARQFVKAMVSMVSYMDDPAFGRFVAQTLSMYRAKGGSHNYSKEQASSKERRQDSEPPPPPQQQQPVQHELLQQQPPPQQQQQPDPERKESQVRDYNDEEEPPPQQPQQPQQKAQQRQDSIGRTQVMDWEDA